MTTEARRPVRRPEGGGDDLRLWLVAVLAIVYLVGWWAFGARAGRPVATDRIVPEVAPSEEPRLAAWYADLPPAERPPVVLPAGWRIAVPDDAAASAVREAASIPVRPVARFGRARIRTRSS